MRARTIFFIMVMALLIQASSTTILSQGADQVPDQFAYITEVSVPETVQPGESFTITLTFDYDFPLFPEYGIPIWYSLTAYFDNTFRALVQFSNQDTTLKGAGTITFSFTVTAPTEDTVLTFTPKFNYYNIVMHPDFDGFPEYFDGDVFEIQVGDTDQSPLSLTTTVLDIYPTTRTNETTLEYNHETQNLRSNVQFSLVNNPPSGITVTLDPTEVTKLDGVSEIKISASLDISNSLTFPSKHTVTILAKSGEIEETIDLTLNLIQPEWLIMMYLAADTDPDLQASMIRNLKDLLVASEEQNPKIGIILLLDLRADEVIEGTQIWKNDAILFQVLDGELVQIGDDWGPTDMSDSKTLSKFITEAQKLVPSKKTHLILGDHGGGYSQGIISDHHQKSGWMSISDFITGLGKSKFDIISFDACHMGQFEVVYPLKDYAKYITVSEAAMPGAGYNYKGFLLELMKKPDVAVEDYLKSIINSHEDKYVEISDGKETTQRGTSSTLSAIDTSKLESLKTEIDDFGKVLSANYKTRESLKPINKISWDQRIMNSNGIVTVHTAHIDIKHFALQLIEKTSNVDVINAANELIEAFDETIIANTGKLYDSGDEVDTAYHGLLVALPWNMLTSLKYYEKTDFPKLMPEWAKFLEDSYTIWKNEPSKTIRIKLDHPEHQLYPHVFDSKGNHVGYDPSLLEYSRTQIALEINGSRYIDYGNGTKIIEFPSDIGEFTFVLDGSKMEEDSEAYTLTYSFLTDDEVTFTETVTGIMYYDTIESTSIDIEDNRLLIEGISTNGEEPSIHTVYLVDVSSPQTVFTDESTTIELTINYNLSTPIQVNPGIYDITNDEWIVDEYYTLEGAGTVSYEYTIISGSTPIEWELEASVWYFLDGDLMHDESDYSDVFEISVVEEEETSVMEEDSEGGGIPGFPYLSIALGLVIVSLLLNRFRAHT